MKSKKNRGVNKNKTMKKNGGIILTTGYTQESAFEHFINNCKFSIFSTSGSACSIILASLNQDIQSPYRTIRTNMFNYPVNKLLLKICSSKITNEVNIQKDVYLKSLKDKNSLLEPLCPCIVFAHTDKLKKSEKKEYKELIETNIASEQDETAMRVLIDTLFEQDVYYIAMELIDDCKPLKYFINTPEFNTYKTIALYELDRLHKIGYMHNDYHFENVLINQNYNYFGIKSGRAYIIDFGCSSVCPEEETRIELLQHELSGINESIIHIFDILDSQRNYIQTKYINSLETRLNVNIYNIVSNMLYRGGKPMNILNETKLKTKPIDDWKVNLDDFKLNLTAQFEKQLQNEDEQGYTTFINSIKNVKKEMKQDSNYINKLFDAQTNGLIIK